MVYRFAKALHYKELEFDESLPSKDLVESLISINFEMGQTRAAKGILDVHTEDSADAGGVNLKVSDSPFWHEKLDEYKQALDGYEALEASRPNDVQPKLGRMRCLRALGEWSALSDIASEAWAEQLAVCAPVQLVEDKSAEVAALGAAASFNLAVHSSSVGEAQSHFQDMNRYVDGMRPGAANTFTYKAILKVHQGELQGCQSYIDDARRVLYDEIAALVAESYSRAYAKVVQLQALSELEEVLMHRLYPEAFPIPHLVRLWGSRISQLTRSVEVWQPLLDVQSLAASPRVNLESSLKFAQLCQKSRRRALAVQTLTSCGAPPINRSPPAARRWSSARRSIAASNAAAAAVDARQRSARDNDTNALSAALNTATMHANHVDACEQAMTLRVWFGFASFLWHDGERHRALSCMQRLLEKHGRPSCMQATAYSHIARGTTLEPTPSTTTDRKLAAKAWLRLGEWQRHLVSDEKSKAPHDSHAEVSTLLSNYTSAAELNPSSYKAWHALAMVHFDIVQSAQDVPEQTRSSTRRGSTLMQGMRLEAEREAAARTHVVQAIRSFFKSIALGVAQQRFLQDILRLLTLWFQYGGDGIETEASAGREGAAGAFDDYSELAMTDDAQRFCVDSAIIHGLRSTPVDVWLAVIPQLIARIHNPIKQIRTVVCDLLVKIGTAHPQGLCFPLTVASHSPVELQHAGATHVLDAMRHQYDTLVQQAHLVASELIRTAALWSEQWQEVSCHARSS